MSSNRLIVEDSEAQKAVEALLALKSPSHYSSNADEEDYLLLEDDGLEYDAPQCSDNSDLNSNVEDTNKHTPYASTHHAQAPFENNDKKIENGFYLAEKSSVRINLPHVAESIPKIYVTHLHQNLDHNVQASEVTLDSTNCPNTNSFNLLDSPNGSSSKISTDICAPTPHCVSKLEKALTQENPRPQVGSISDFQTLTKPEKCGESFSETEKVLPSIIPPFEETRKLISSPSKYCFGIASNKVIEDKQEATRNDAKTDPQVQFQMVAPDSKKLQITNQTNSLCSNTILKKEQTNNNSKPRKKRVIEKPKKGIHSLLKDGQSIRSPSIPKSSLHSKLKLRGISNKTKKLRKRSQETKLTNGKTKQKKEKIKNTKFVKEIAKAFSQEISTLKLNKLTPLQACQIDLLVKHEKSKQVSERQPTLVIPQKKDSLLLSSTVRTKFKDSHNKPPIDGDEMLPIQAEVVMSEESDSEVNKRNQGIEEEVNNYLKTFVSSNSLDTLIEYPPKNNEVPVDGSNLTTWQLDEVRLPRFTPLVHPPPWLRLTIPAEGYCCHSCGDTFFIESSLVQHRERRSIWISLECGPCDAKLIFYNRCAFKDHIREHLLRGECVDEETVTVRSLPLQLTKLLQPIRVPVPETLRPDKNSSRTCSKSFHTRITNDKENFDSNDILSNFGAVETRQNFSSPPPLSPNLTPLTEESSRLSPLKRPIRCYLCERMFHNVRELMTHMKTNQPWSDQRVECRKCHLVLPSVCAAKAHILTHPPANSGNISVCPECGSRCDGPRDFVHHLNTCGHQFRRSGILCVQCKVCFFKINEEFVDHWLKEHCAKSYECILCLREFEAPAYHRCSSGEHLLLSSFQCLLTCPLCQFRFNVNEKHDKQMQNEMENHLVDSHPTVINRVHYTFKSKFCSNSFHSKDELRAHHDREHRKDDQYRTKSCTLHHEVLSVQQKFFDGQEPRNAFVSLSIALSQEEIEDAKLRDVPTVSSIVEMPPDSPPLNKIKVEKPDSPDSPVQTFPVCEEVKIKSEVDPKEKLKPCVCYRCGYSYTDYKYFRKHQLSCEGEFAERMCQHCGVTARGEEFARHCHTHICDGLIICIFCNAAQFSTISELHQHFELHTKEQFSYPAICAFCSFLMTDESCAFSHLTLEHDSHRFSNDLEYECEKCGRKFHGERGLNIHLTRCTVGAVTPPTPTPTPGRQCLVCKKGLTAEMYGKHIVGHLEEGLLVCSLCDGLMLPSSMALLHHLEEHSATLSYPTTCPMCSSEMCNPVSALTHLKEDHGFGNLSCSECEMHYTFSYQLQRHIDIAHKVCLYAKRRYICWICRAYDHVKKETLMNHFRLVHGLSVDEVDEKAIIRTRGQGTMPSTQFIPTKPLGSKEISPNSKIDKTDSETIIKSTPVKSDIQESTPNEKEIKNKNSESKITPPVDESQVKKEILDNLEEYFGDSELASNSRGKAPPTKGKNSLRKKKLLVKSKVKRRLVKEMTKNPSATKVVKKEKEINPKVNSVVKQKKKYQCDKCNFCTNTPSKIAKHRPKHKKKCKVSDGYVCHECGESFVVEPSLIRHLFFAHKIKKQVPSETIVNVADPRDDIPDIKSETENTKVDNSNPGQICQKSKSYPRKNPPTIRTKKEPKRKIKGRKEPKGKKEPALNISEAVVSECEDSDLKCCVCKEEFSTSMQLYSHLRTHGMAFLKLGHKKRNLCQ